MGEITEKIKTDKSSEKKDDFSEVNVEREESKVWQTEI